MIVYRLMSRGVAVLLPAVLGCHGPIPTPDTPPASALMPVATGTITATATVAPALPEPTAIASAAPGAPAVTEPPFVPWSEAPSMANAPATPVRVQEEGQAPVDANHVVLRFLERDLVLFVYSDACVSGICGVSLVLPGNTLRRSWGPGSAPIVVPMSNSNQTAYALQITSYKSEPAGGGYKPFYRIGTLFRAGHRLLEGGRQEGLGRGDLPRCAHRGQAEGVARRAQRAALEALSSGVQAVVVALTAPLRSGPLPCDRVGGWWSLVVVVAAATAALGRTPAGMNPDHLAEASMAGFQKTLDGRADAPMQSPCTLVASSLARARSRSGTTPARPASSRLRGGFGSSSAAS